MKGHARKRCRCTPAERKNCRHAWAFVIDLERDPVTGKRKQKWVSGFKTEDQANKAMRAALVAIDNERDPFPAETTLREYIDGWLDVHATQVRPRTIHRYRQLMTGHVLPQVGNHRLRRLTPGHVRKVWMAMEGAGQSPATIRQARAALGKSMNDAVADGLLDRNPVAAARAPRVPKPDLAVIRPEHVKSLLRTTSGSRWEIPVLLAAMTGMRRSEVLALSWRQVDLDAGTLRVSRSLHVRPKPERGADEEDRYYFEEPKTESGRRTIRLAPSLVKSLRRHRLEQAQRRLTLGSAWTDLDLVCDNGRGRPVDPDAFGRAFKRLAKTADLPAGSRLHDLRHACAVLLRLEGVPIVAVAEMLGHASASFTISNYEHVVHEMQEATVEALERRLGS